MSKIVIYKTKYGSAKAYARWISEALGCDMVNAKDIKINDLYEYDTIIYGGGLYAEVINGVSFITKNLDKLKGKNIIVYSVGITPLECRDYYDKLVLEKNFRPEMLSKIKVYNFLGKMIIDELSLPHKMALKSLKKIMSGKENPTEMEKLLITLCDADDDFSNKDDIKELIDYVNQKQHLEIV